MKGACRIIATKKQQFDKAEYDRQYAKENLIQIRLSLHKRYDADIIEKLQAVPNRSAYVKKLIRDDLKSDQ